MPKTDKETLLPQLGKALRTLRGNRGMTEKEVAIRMGKKASAETQIARWERGDASPLSHQLWAYLLAIDSSFADLDRVLNPKPATNLRLREIARELESLAKHGK